MDDKMATFVPSLPTELVDNILRHLDRPTLAKGARASRQFNSLTAALLYRSIILDSEYKILVFVNAPRSAARYVHDISISLGRALSWDYSGPLTKALVSLVKFCASIPRLSAIQAPLDIISEIIVPKDEGQLASLTHMSVLCPLAVFWEPVLDRASRLGFGNGGFDAFYRRLALRPPLRVTHLHMSSSAALAGLDVFYNEDRNRAAERNPFLHVMHFSYDEPSCWESSGAYIDTYDPMAGWHRHLPALETMTCRFPDAVWASKSHRTQRDGQLQIRTQLASWKDERLFTQQVPAGALPRRDAFGIRVAVEEWERLISRQESMWKCESPVYTSSSSQW